MNIKQRLAKLEEAMPEPDSGLKLLWRSVVRRDGNGLLWERPFYAVLVRLPAAPNEILRRHEAEGQAAFLARVMDAVRRVHGREDPVFEDEVQWRPDPLTDHTE